MKKILFIIVTASCLISCGNGDYYYEESRAKQAYYATDSTECVVEGIWVSMSDPTRQQRAQTQQRRMDYIPPGSVSAIMSEDATYYYQWHYAGPIGVSFDSVANTRVNFGDSIRAYGIVRNITNQAGVRFQDILIDSVEVLKSIYRYVDTIENVVVQGEFTAINLQLSEHGMRWDQPCLYDCKYEDMSDWEIYYINTDVNYKPEHSYYVTAYLCNEPVQYGEWVEANCTLIQGLNMNDEPYWLINMNSVKKIPTPEGENW